MLIGIIAANPKRIDKESIRLRTATIGLIAVSTLANAWSAGRLFQKAALTAGPRLTRKALFAQLKQIHSWSDYGLHVTQDIGNKREANCTLYMEIRNQQFTRIFPSSGWSCAGSLMPTPNY